MKILDLLQAVAKVKTRGAWNNGVKIYAVGLLSNADCNRECEVFTSLCELKDAILNGAKDWKQYSEDGHALIYNTDIAERLCSPSELKKTKNGLNDPNSREIWVQVQTRALLQAWEMIKRTYNEMPKDKYSVIPYPAASDLWCVYDNYAQCVIFGHVFKSACEKWVSENK